MFSSFLQLKLFAMKRTIYPVIDSNYDPKAYNTAKIKEYHCKAGHVSGLLISFQVFFPIFVFVWATLIVTYCTCTRSPHKEYLWDGTTKTDTKEQINEQWEIKIQLSIIFTLSVLFSIYSLLMSAIAVGVQEHNLSENVRMWYYFRNNIYQIKIVYVMPIVMLMEDIFYLLMPIIIVCCVNMYWKKEWCVNVKEERFWWMVAAYSIVTPATNLAVHFNSILIGLILDQQHALGAGIFYTVMIITIVKVLRMVAEVSKTVGKNHYCKDVESRDRFKSCVKRCMCCCCMLLSACASACEKKNHHSSYDKLDSESPPNQQPPPSPDPKDDHDNRLISEKWHFIFFMLSILAYAVIAAIIIGTFAFIAAVYVTLPINNAFDEAPARVQLIYTAVFGAFIAGLMYWLIRRKKAAPAEDTHQKKSA